MRDFYPLYKSILRNLKKVYIIISKNPICREITRLF